jgi:hypothetical protein
MKIYEQSSAVCSRPYHPKIKLPNGSTARPHRRGGGNADMPALAFAANGCMHRSRSTYGRLSDDLMRHKYR